VVIPDGPDGNKTRRNHRDAVAQNGKVWGGSKGKGGRGECSSEWQQNNGMPSTLGMATFKGKLTP